jgi:putative pyoverdin transport system ATP-binding/permease protein
VPFAGADVAVTTEVSVLVSLIPPRSWLVAVGAILAGLVSGAASAGLIALVNTALHHGDFSTRRLMAWFAGLVATKIGSQAVARLLLNRFSQQTLADLCRDLSRRVLAAPLRHLEHVGIARILATLTDDVAWLGWAAQNVPTAAMNAAVLVGCGIYLGWLSPSILLVAALVVGIGAVGYRVLTTRAYRYLQRARDTRDALFDHFRALTEGMKELKLHTARREAFLTERIETTTEELRRHTLAGVRHHLVADTWNQLLFYGVLVGMLIWAPSGSNRDTETVTGYVLATMYMMAPVWAIIEAWPIFARGRIALEKITELGVSLGRPDDAASAPVRPEGPRAWHRLDFEGATFTYPPDIDGRAFVLGPLDLTLTPGELVFLVGGNGSGKSTFVKLLTGLYTPHVGAIRLDGQLITDTNQDWYRDHFSAVFTDFYLFDRLLGLGGDDLDGRARRYLVDLELDAKLQIRGGVLSTTALSQGQRKRLALLTAFLEDRPIYVFDEWAADQDVHYREIFYTRLLADLRARGKTVVVISHDDRYYHLGDRVVKLDYGQLVEDRRAAR